MKTLNLSLSDRECEIIEKKREEIKKIMLNESLFVETSDQEIIRGMIRGSVDGKHK